MRTCRLDNVSGALLKRSVAAFDELKQGIRDIEFLSDRTTGEVRIGAPNALAGFVAAVIQKFTRQYTRVVCRLMVGETCARSGNGKSIWRSPSPSRRLIEIAWKPRSSTRPLGS